MKVSQPIGTKGSLKWIQTLINDFPYILDQHVINQLGLDYRTINWLSPQKDDNYAEYRDEDFLEILGLKQFKKKLHGFWPKRGPQWDALGRAKKSGPYFLVDQVHKQSQKNPFQK
jgi:hypothetical protein